MKNNIKQNVWITLLYSRNYHKVVNQLYFSKFCFIFVFVYYSVTPPDKTLKIRNLSEVSPDEPGPQDFP